MKTDELKIARSPEARSDSLDKIELMALYAGMARRDASSMRLLAEELLTATKSIADNYNGRLWMELDQETFTIHLCVDKPTGKAERDKLTALSKDGKANAPKGLFSRLSAAVEDMLLDMAQAESDAYKAGLILTGTPDVSGSMYIYHFMPAMPTRQSPHEEPADELAGIEKSIIDSIVDDILVTSRSGNVEITALKKLG